MISSVHDIYREFPLCLQYSVDVRDLIRKPSTSEKQSSISDNALGWIGIAFALIAAVILDKENSPHKWHAAIMWTFVAFFGVLIFGRKKRGSRLFWVLWTACLVLHTFAMWLLFGQLMPRLILGTLYIVPVAFIESLLLLLAILRMERRLAHSAERHQPGR